MGYRTHSRTGNRGYQKLLTNLYKKEKKIWMKGSNSKRVADSALREFILITLAHIEKRDISEEQVAKRLRDAFKCEAIVIAKEEHKEGGSHLHVALKNSNASKNNATRIIREIFKEFEGNQCNVKFHKGWGVMVGYVTKEDKEPYTWGKYSRKEVLEMGEVARKKRKGARDIKPIIEHIQSCDQWLDIYKSEVVTERLLFGSYSSIRSVYEDLAIIKHTEKTPIQRIEEYLLERKNQGAEVEEYAPEDLHEKYILLDWLACNLMFKRPIKTKQLHIYGPPSTQKTLMFEALKKVLRTYFASSRINDFAGADDLYDLWVYDEFHLLDNNEMDGINAQAAQAYSNILLKVLDGQECRLDAKYSRIFTKTKNIPIVVIANQVTPRARRYGPFQERFLRLRFVTNIENLKEERVIATLMGCMKRRAEQVELNQVGAGEKELAYNSAKVLGLDYENVEKCTVKSPWSVRARTTAGESLEMVFMECRGPKKKGQREQLYPAAEIRVKQGDIDRKKMSTLLFALIPLKKREGNEEDQLKFMRVFNSRRKGTDFRLVRRKAGDQQDYMIWPIRLFLRNSNRTWPTEIQVVGGTYQLDEILESVENPEENTMPKTMALNDHLQIGLGTFGKDACGPNWDNDDWDTDD